MAQRRSGANGRRRVVVVGTLVQESGRWIIQAALLAVWIVAVLWPDRPEPIPPDQRALFLTLYAAFEVMTALVMLNSAAALITRRALNAAIEERAIGIAD